MAINIKNIIYSYFAISAFVALALMFKYSGIEIRMYAIFFEKDKLSEAIFKNLEFSLITLLALYFLQHFNIKYKREFDFQEEIIYNFWIVIFFYSGGRITNADVYIVVIYIEMYLVLKFILFELQDFPLILNPPTIKRHQQILKAQLLAFIFINYLMVRYIKQAKLSFCLIILFLKSLESLILHVIYIIDRKERGETRKWKDATGFTTALFDFLCVLPLPDMFWKYVFLAREGKKLVDWYNARKIIKAGFKKVENTSGEDCLICREPLSNDDAVALDCGHVFHSSCIEHWVKSKSQCPICRRAIRVERYNLDEPIEKAEQALSRLKELRDKLKRNEANDNEPNNEEIPDVQ